MQGLLVTQMKLQLLPHSPAPEAPAHFCDLIYTLSTPPSTSSSHTGLVFMSSHFMSLPPQCLCICCCSRLECSSSWEHHLLRGPFHDCERPQRLSSLGTPLLFLILLWLVHWWVDQKGTGTQMFSECLLGQWMASGPSCG